MNDPGKTPSNATKRGTGESSWRKRSIVLTRTNYKTSLATWFNLCNVIGRKMRIATEIMMMLCNIGGGNWFHINGVALVTEKVNLE